MEDLTSRQKQVYNFIRKYVDKHGYPPTIREIQEGFGLKSTKGVKDHIDKLVEKGYLRRRNGSARALELVMRRSGKPNVTLVPVVGRVAAGVPLLATENIVGRIPVSRDVARGEGYFFLRVRGDSMTGAAILDNDLVLVRPQPFVEQGEIAVVMVDDEATIKRFYMRKGRIELVAENEDFPTLGFEPGSDRIRVLGRVVAVYRSLDQALSPE
ncbi:transcriptional repressor LexA [Candidatus Fermentibacteria bacterium]|nr:transcriptional repressor LexA [Candidatus Fermentibacteria bacterium]